MWKAAQTWWQSVVVPPRQRPWYFIIYLLVLGPNSWAGFVKRLSS